MNKENSKQENALTICLKTTTKACKDNKYKNIKLCPDCDLILINVEKWKNKLSQKCFHCDKKFSTCPICPEIIQEKNIQKHFQTNHPNDSFEESMEDYTPSFVSDTEKFEDLTFILKINRQLQNFNNKKSTKIVKIEPPKNVKNSKISQVKGEVVQTSKRKKEDKGEIFVPEEPKNLKRKIENVEQDTTQSIKTNEPKMKSKKIEETEIQSNDEEEPKEEPSEDAIVFEQDKPKSGMESFLGSFKKQRRKKTRSKKNKDKGLERVKEFKEKNKGKEFVEKAPKKEIEE
jgi:hypothetical protein